MPVIHAGPVRILFDLTGRAVDSVICGDGAHPGVAGCTTRLPVIGNGNTRDNPYPTRISDAKCLLDTKMQAVERIIIDLVSLSTLGRFA